jgi:hypothetical protein
MDAILEWDGLYIIYQPEARDKSKQFETVHNTLDSG